MKPLPLVTLPAKNLREPSDIVTDVTDTKYKTLVPQMIKTMHKEDGVGLAAPQIGINIRLIIVYTKHSDLVCFNPKIVKKSLFKSLLHEGCLSVPGKYGQIKRHRSVRVQFTDTEGKEQLLDTHGLLAEIFQHEVDHLDGILYIDKAKKVEIDKKNYGKN